MRDALGSFRRDMSRYERMQQKSRKRHFIFSWNIREREVSGCAFSFRFVGGGHCVSREGTGRRLLPFLFLAGGGKFHLVWTFAFASYTNGVSNFFERPHATQLVAPLPSFDGKRRTHIHEWPLYLWIRCLFLFVSFSQRVQSPLVTLIISGAQRRRRVKLPLNFVSWIL